VSSSDEYSSSPEVSSSSDDFPSPDTPKNRKNNRSREEMYERMKELQRKLYEMEIQNKKLRAKYK
jgi:hypothetical protein